MKELLAKLLPAVLSLPYGILLTRLFARRELLKGTPDAGKKKRAAIAGIVLTVLAACFCALHGRDIRMSAAFMTVFACLYGAGLSDLRDRTSDDLYAGIIALCGLVPGGGTEHACPFALRLAGAVGILAVFLTVNLISRGKTVGGADLKLASAFWFACGPFRGTIALLIALPAAAITEGVKKALRRKGNGKKENKCSYTTNGTGRRGRPENGGAEEGFPLVPYLTAGCLCAAAIPYLPV